MPGLPCMKHCPASQIDCADVVEPASIDLDECIERLYKKELLAESVIEAICAKAKELLMKESNVVHIAAPVTVVGDIHGQFFDMLEIFKIGGFCPNTNYLFLGKLLGRPGSWQGERISALTVTLRRLCRSRSFQCRNDFPSCLSQIKIPPSRSSHPRQPRVARRYSVLRILHGVCTKIRQCQCLALFHRHVRFSYPERGHQRPDILRPWRSFSFNPLD
jgi:hypothetical protein